MESSELIDAGVKGKIPNGYFIRIFREPMTIDKVDQL
jgi:hypothetical protein